MLVTGNMVFILQAWCFKRGLNFDEYVSVLAARSSDSAGEHVIHTMTRLNTFCRIIVYQCGVPG